MADDGQLFPPELRELLDSPVCATATTVSASGAPQSSVIWFERRGDDIVFFAEPHTTKVKNLERDPRIVFIVVDPDRTHAPGVPAYVRIAGRANLLPGEEDFADRLARDYGNAGGYPWPKAPYLNVHVTVDRVSGLGPFPTKKLGGWQPKKSS